DKQRGPGLDPGRQQWGCVLHADLRRPVEHEAQGALRAMLGDQDDGAAEVGVEEASCSEEERATQRFHVRILTNGLRGVLVGPPGPFFKSRSGVVQALPGSPRTPGCSPNPPPRLRRGYFRGGGRFASL